MSLLIKTNHLDRSYLLIVGRCTTNLMLLKWDIPGLFFFIFVFLIQLTVKNVPYKSLPMSRFKPRNSGVRSNRSTNLATTTTLNFCYLVRKWLHPKQQGVASVSLQTIIYKFPKCWQVIILTHRKFLKGIFFILAIPR